MLDEMNVNDDEVTIFRWCCEPPFLRAFAEAAHCSA
jgi:hypothetical protein